MLVDEKFIASLQKDGPDRSVLLKELLPPRPWMEEKLNRFLENLQAQQRGEE